MAARRITRKEMKRDEFVTAMGRITLWMEMHAREVLILGALLVAGAIASVVVWQYLGQREEKASLLLARGVEMLHAGVQGENGADRPGGMIFATGDEKHRAVLDQMDALLQTYPRSQAGRLALYYKGLSLTNLRRPREAVKAIQDFLASSPGSFAAPMARAAIGGMISSTLLTLVVVPIVYTLIDDFAGLFRRKKNGEVFVGEASLTDELDEQFNRAK